MNNWRLLYRIWLGAGAVTLALTLVLIYQATRPALWGSLRNGGPLIVLTQTGATSLHMDAFGNPTGFEYELVSAFADHLGVKVRVVMLDTVQDVLKALKQGKGHLAAGITRTPKREEEFRFAPDYMTVRQQFVCHRYGRRPKRLADLPKFNIEIAANSSYGERLSALKDGMPDLTWTVAGDFDTEQVFARVAARKVDCTIAHSNIVALNRRFHPELVVPITLPGGRGQAWALPKHSARLQKELREWYAKPRTAALINELQERFYGHVGKFDFVDLIRFRKRVTTRLPKYKSHLRRAARRHDLPWLLLAAVAYQESHWDHEAESPTGVQGLMMLTNITASDLGVEDRTDPKQSIDGGAKYLADLLLRVPDSVEGSDRVWFALAAYNVGIGHMYDARHIARSIGRNPDRWTDLAAVLPLLTEKKYYTMQGVKYGYARGKEPVRYVKRIRQYLDILQRMQQG